MKTLNLPLSYRESDYSDTVCVIRDRKGNGVIHVPFSGKRYEHTEQEIEDAEALAYRVAACVNACRGIATGALEAGVLRGPVQIFKDGLEEIFGLPE
jgi:hypothetical protein